MVWIVLLRISDICSNLWMSKLKFKVLSISRQSIWLICNIYNLWELWLLWLVYFIIWILSSQVSDLAVFPAEMSLLVPALCWVRSDLTDCEVITSTKPTQAISNGQLNNQNYANLSDCDLLYLPIRNILTARQAGWVGRVAALDNYGGKLPRLCSGQPTPRTLFLKYRGDYRWGQYLFGVVTDSAWSQRLTTFQLH